MASNSTKRFVAVKVSHGSRTYELDVDLEKYRVTASTTEDEVLFNTDLALLKRGLSDKKKNLAYLFNNEEATYRVKSEADPEREVDIGDSSPIKSTHVKCNIYGQSRPLYEVVNFLRADDLNLANDLSLGTMTLENNLICLELTVPQTSTPLRSKENVNHMPCSQEPNVDVCSETACQPVVSINRHFDLKKFKLPTFFGVQINDKLSGNDPRPLTVGEESKICRRVVDIIREQTIAPKPEAVVEVARLLYQTFPLIDAFGSRKATEKKLTDCLSRKRLEEGKPLNSGGRPRKEKGTDYSPSGCLSVQPSLNLDSDLADYYANIKKLKELYVKAPQSQSISVLQAETFQVRRFIVTRTENALDNMNVLAFMNEHCPMFRHYEYLFRELDSVLGKNTSKNFLDEWVNVHRKIILAAEKKSAKNSKIRDILISHPIEEDNSLLALKLLPHIAGFNMRNKSKKPELFFFHEIDESANLSTSIKVPNRPSPFIMLCGKTFHIVVDREPILAVEADSAKTFLALMASYFVFHVQYEDTVATTLLWAQSVLLKKPDQMTNSTKVRKVSEALNGVEVTDCWPPLDWLKITRSRSQ